jgi:hypothetical protein
MGLTSAEMLAAIAALTRRNFELRRPPDMAGRLSHGDPGPEGRLHQDYAARAGAGDPIQGAMSMDRICLNRDGEGHDAVRRQNLHDRARRHAAAGDELALRERERQSKEMRRIRNKLGLSQIAAARLTGGAYNAFSPGLPLVDALRRPYL